MSPQVTDLHEVPLQYQQALQGEAFLLYVLDNRTTVIMKTVKTRGGCSFSLQEKTSSCVKVPFGLSMGHSRSVPSLFMQFFTILELGQWHGLGGDDTSLPFVYALLTGKETEQYMEFVENLIAS